MGRVSFVVSLLCFLGWVSVCVRAVKERLRVPLDLNLALLLTVFFCVPFVGVFAPIWAVSKLAHATNPSKWPPVVVEREREGSEGDFRSNAVERIVTGAIARPFLGLWGVIWFGSQIFPVFLNFSLELMPLYLVVEALAILLTIRVTGAITRNLVESYRRASAR